MAAVMDAVGSASRDVAEALDRHPGRRAGRHRAPSTSTTAAGHRSPVGAAATGAMTGRTGTIAAPTVAPPSGRPRSADRPTEGPVAPRGGPAARPVGPSAR